MRCIVFRSLRTPFAGVFRPEDIRRGVVFGHECHEVEVEELHHSLGRYIAVEEDRNPVFVDELEHSTRDSWPTSGLYLVGADTRMQFSPDQSADGSS
ncbi:hypothetical protein DQ392_18220 [Streptomyces reniochalinae]|uniref:Uncharacterized protein n=1 Tax=Streptomyces reniochalinae TaxID=2250578 RepID=A0A367EI20_9ACTN|nr:hypothetical protein DQ392_18220 [Streptomyces reniochalinae]